MWALQNASAADVSRLAAIYQPVIRATDGSGPSLGDGLMTDADVDEVLDILERCGARRHAEEEAHRYRDLALGNAAALPVPEGQLSELRILVESVIAT